MLKIHYKCGSLALEVYDLIFLLFYKKTKAKPQKWFHIN